MLIPTQATPTLEGIPTEILILILFQIPDRASLKAIVHSSPVCHQAYLAVRQEVLDCLLKSQYGGTEALLDLSEAITAVRSKGLLFKHHREEAIAFLDTWRRKNEITGLSQRPTLSPRIDEPCNLEETIKLLRLYEELHFFLEDYATNAPRPTWMQSDQWHDTVLPIGLSTTEKRRFLRALCRLQTFANIFGLPEAEIDFSNKEGIWVVSREEMNDWHMYAGSEHEVYQLFFAPMPPWEYEEMGCVWSYLITKYEPIVKEISDDLRKLASETGCQFFWDIMPKSQRPPLGCPVEVLSNLGPFEDASSLLLAIGPVLLYRILHLEHLVRRRVVLGNAPAVDISVSIGNLYVSWDEKLPLIYPADRHEAPNFEQRWSTLPSIEQPNLGWKRAWLLPHTAEQDLEGAIFYDREPRTDWDWGYAIWDAERLEEWNAPLEQLTVRDP